MDQFMKIGGKTSDNKAMPISVDGNGLVNTHHVWEGKMVRIVNESPRDTSVIISDEVDLSGYALPSLRVINNTDQDVTINLYTDVVDSGVSTTAYLADVVYNDVKLVIGHGNRNVVITPDDIPCLPYLNKIKVRVSYSTAPTSGSLKIFVSVKR